MKGGQSLLRSLSKKILKNIVSKVSYLLSFSKLIKSDKSQFGFILVVSRYIFLNVMFRQACVQLCLPFPIHFVSIEKNCVKQEGLLKIGNKPPCHFPAPPLLALDMI